MSFGFGVGDFIAVGELCWKLYSQVYEVSCGAPEAIQNLKAELGDMHLTINKLVEDTKDPDSILVQSGPDRLNLACSVLEKTQETLKKLDDLSGKYELLQKPSSHLAKRHFWKRNYDKVKFAAESRTINDLRAKLVFHNGQISLLLQIVQNSSLERIENIQKKTENALQDIKAAISGTTSTTPLLSGVNGVSQHRMTRKLLENAEVDGRPWTSIGIRDWLQTGKWWLLKAQSQLYSAAPQTPEYSQARVDLIKASWILTDIVALHPQRSFFGSGIQEMDILDIVQAVKSQHEDLSKKSFPSPALHELESSSWTIWIATSSTALLPSLEGGGPGSRQWGTVGGFILFRRFAILHASNGTHECIVFLEVKKEKTFTLIVQSFEGQDLCRHSIPENFNYENYANGRRDIQNCMYLRDENELEFFTRADFLTAYLLTRGVERCVHDAAEYQPDETLIYTMTLLDILSTRSRSFDEALGVIKPRTVQLYDSGNGKEHSKLLWDLMQTLTTQQLANYWELHDPPSHCHGRFILHFSESLEQCSAIFNRFPKLMWEGELHVIEAAMGVDFHYNTSESRHAYLKRILDRKVGLSWRFYTCRLLEHTRGNKILTHELLNGLSHSRGMISMSPLDLAKYSLKSRNWYGIRYIVTRNGSIGINDKFPSEIWNLEFAPKLMDHYDSAVLELLHERPSALDVFKETPYLTTFVVIADGLQNAALRLSSRGLLHPNLPDLMTSHGVDALSSLHRSGIPHWPLCMAINFCAHPKIIEALCQSGAHLGSDDEVLSSDLEVYKALLSRLNSQAQKIYNDTTTSTRAALDRPKLLINPLIVPQDFFKEWFQSRRKIRSYIYSPEPDDDDNVDYKSPWGSRTFELSWKPEVLRILRETQAERNLHAWLRRNATITDALS